MDAKLPNLNKIETRDELRCKQAEFILLPVNQNDVVKVAKDHIRRVSFHLSTPVTQVSPLIVMSTYLVVWSTT